MANRPTVIVADSNESFLVYLSTLLSRMNFEVLPIEKVTEVYDLARIVKPKLIFLEAGSDGDSGIELMGKIHQDDLLGNTPVIMLGAEESLAERCFAAGCSDFLTKPVDLTHLHISVQKCLPNREGMRKHLRAPFNQKVSFVFASMEVKCYAITLSEGGIFLRTNKPLPVGSRVEVKVPIDTDAEIKVKGTIVYSMGLSKGKFLIPPGIAVQFDESDSEDMKRLSKRVCRLLIGDIVDEQEEPIFKCLKGHYE
jgi:uncharacterized protein (TIGR02266 family)